MTSHREKLGDFSSVVCFKAVIVGVEDTLGEDGAAVVFTRAGRVRGQQLAISLGLGGKPLPLEELAGTLDAALGVNGTRLCSVEKASMDGENIVIDTQETVCSAGEVNGSSRKCTFTLGAIWGALETATGTAYIGEHTESVLRGGKSDKFVFRPL
jgi:hypothetical protein